MNIFVDENIPVMTVRELRLMGHDVRDIRGTLKQGIADDELWLMVQREKQLLITTDKGFSQYRHESHFGILIIRLKQPNRREIHKRAIKAVTRYSEKQWRRRIVVMKDAVQSTWKFRNKEGKV